VRHCDEHGEENSCSKGQHGCCDSQCVSWIVDVDWARSSGVEVYSYGGHSHGDPYPTECHVRRLLERRGLGCEVVLRERERERERKIDRRKEHHDIDY
jgi:hypothetical protein